MLFNNILPESLTVELDIANKKSSESNYDHGFGPYAEGTSGFKNLLQSKELLIFVITKKNGCCIAKRNLSHTALASGFPVLAAGEIQTVKKKKKQIKINNRTGHYQTDKNSLEKAAKYFSDLGYRIKEIQTFEKMQTYC